jgi:hypothetical protein
MKVILVLILIGFSIGLWFGVNIGKGNPLYENPFNDADIFDDAQESADDQGIVDQGKEYLQEKKDKVKDSFKEIVEDM